MTTIMVTLTVEIDHDEYIRRYGSRIADVPGHMKDNVETLMIYHFDRSRLGTLLSNESTIVNTEEAAS